MQTETLQKIPLKVFTKTISCCGDCPGHGSPDIGVWCCTIHPKVKHPRIKELMIFRRIDEWNMLSDPPEWCLLRNATEKEREEYLKNLSLGADDK